MKIFVINLAESTDRRHKSAQQLDELGVDYEFFDACRGDQGHERFFGEFARDDYLISTRRLPSAAEIGCYASHLMLWRRCVEMDQPIVILEDDFNLQPNFTRALEVAEKYIDKLGFLRLHPIVLRPKPNSRRMDKRTKIVESDGFTISFMGKVTPYTLSYVVSPAAAAAFIATSNSLTAPVDKYLQKVWVHQQPIFALEPACVLEGSTAIASTIGDRSVKEQLSMKIKIARQLSRVAAIFRRFIFRWQQVPKFRSLGKA